MKFRELKITVVTKQQVHFRDIGEKLGSLIHFAMTKDEELKLFHKQPVPKHYTFSHLYPTEKDGYYKPGMGYIFRFRSAEERLLNKMARLLNRLENDYFLVLNAEDIEYEKHQSYKVRTLTPFVITLKDGETKYWKSITESKEDIVELLEQNLNSRYSHWLGLDKMYHHPIRSVQMLTNKPTYYHYKGTKILANKIMITFHRDELSQKINEYVVRAGIGEKSSVLGSGFTEIV